LQAACGLIPLSSPRIGLDETIPGASGPIMKLSRQSPIEALTLKAYVDSGPLQPSLRTRPAQRTCCSDVAIKASISLNIVIIDNLKPHKVAGVREVI
jgi:hypothetical protein